MIRDADDTYSYTFLPDGRVDTMIAVGDPTAMAAGRVDPTANGGPPGAS